ncbi:MAG TPA: hypothetical protein VH137_01320 [Gemmatimonadales bacterium]|nr:hypothetical protein [Gemmatimonadales bacterium]
MRRAATEAALGDAALFDEPITKRRLAVAVLALGGTALAVRRSLALRPAR